MKENNNESNNIEIPFTVSLPVQAVESNQKPVIPYSERLAAFLAAPEWFESVFSHVANGGSLIDFAAGHKLKHSDILAAISSDVAIMGRYEIALKAREEWAREAILKELRLMAFVDPAEIYDELGAVRQMHEIPETTRRAIKEIEVFEEFEGSGADRRQIGITKKIKFHDKIKPLELAGKNFGFFADRLKLDATEKLEDILAAANALSISGEVVDVTPTDGPTNG